MKQGNTGSHPEEAGRHRKSSRGSRSTQEVIQRKQGDTGSHPEEAGRHRKSSRGSRATQEVPLLGVRQVEHFISLVAPSLGPFISFVARGVFP